MRRSSLSLAFLLASALAATVVARADETDKGGKAPAGKAADKGAKGKDDKNDKPDIRWAPTWREAKEEAAERNVAIFLHSHSST